MVTWLRSFFQALPVIFFDWLALDGQKCFSYGGEVRHVKLPLQPAYEVRVCTKNRWHTDSHAYEFVRMPYVYPKDEAR